MWDIFHTLLPSSDPTPTLPPEPGKSFTFNCERKLLRRAGGPERLTMSLGENESCILKLTNLEPDSVVEVETKLRSGLNRSIEINPAKGSTNKNGELNVKITAIKKGIDWVAWGIPNEEGKIRFDKNAYDNGKSWGMFVEIKCNYSA